MSTLRSALDELTSEDLEETADRQLGDDVVELRTLTDALEAEWLRRVAEVDRRQLYLTDGSVSTASWLARRCRIGASTARDKVRVARALGRMPGTRTALASGDISFGHTRALVAVFEAHPDAFGDHEPVLVDTARRLSVRKLRRAVDYWRQNLDWKAALADANHLYQRRRLHLSRTFLGMVRIDGDLDPEGGEVVMTALQALVDPAVRASEAESSLSPAQRRADALVDVCRDFLNRGDRPATGGERPHITVTVDLDILEKRAGRRCELDHTGVVHPEAARRLACDAGVARLITTPDSEPLDVGRRTRTVPPSIRRALVVRDQECRFPGCDRPHRWCDAHHIVHWVDGGPTAVDNLILLCRHHHRLIHEGQFRLKATGGGPRFTRPDGNPVDNRGPPPTW